MSYLKFDLENEIDNEDKKNTIPTDNSIGTNARLAVETEIKGEILRRDQRRDFKICSKTGRSDIVYT